MSHLQESMQRMAENDPSIIKIRRIPVGTPVLYHGRMGAMRQGRTEFPATVLKQHEDDGSLDLIVFFEAEDTIWEQRVMPKSDAQPGHCWSLIDPVAREGEPANDLRATINELRAQMYGDYNAPEQSMIEYLDGFDKKLNEFGKQLRALEKMLRK
jgi:hypothetical protein